MQASKRARTEPLTDEEKARQRARAIAKKITDKYPYKRFGRGYFERGTPDNIEMWGETYKTADETQRERRKEYGYTGRGLYSKAPRRVRGSGGYGRDVGKMLGGYIGGMYGQAELGQRAGSWIGAKAQRLIKKVTGRGAYENSLMLSGNSDSIPVFRSAGNETGDLSVAKKEYVCDIQGTSAFTLQNFLINPGNSALFPWLSQIAVNYEEYEFRGLIFHFKTVTSVLSTTSAQVGTVIMCANYNVNNPNFSNKQQMLEYDSSASTQINNDLTFGIECDPAKNAMCPTLFVTTAQSISALNNNSSVNEQDPKTYFLANFQIATNSCIATGEIAELWVSYDLVLRKPKQYTSLLLQQNYAAVVVLAATNGLGGAVSAGSASGIQTGVAAGQQLPNSVTNSYNNGGGGFSCQTGAFVVGYRWPDTLGSGTYKVTLFVSASAAITFSGAYAVFSGNVTGSSDVFVAGNQNTGVTGNISVNTVMVELIVVINQSAVNAGISGSTQQGTYATYTLTSLTGTSVGYVASVEQINPNIGTLYLGNNSFTGA